MVRAQNCCCFSLKTGCLIIATLGWILTLSKIFGMIGAAADNKEEHHGGIHHEEIDGSLSGATLGYRIGYAIGSLICSILLVVGIYKRSANYFIPWLIVDCLECVGSTIITVIVFVFIFLLPNPANIYMGIMFVILVGVCALSWYFWIVVYSFYQEIKSEVLSAPTGGNIYYSPTSTNPPPYDKDRAQMA